MDRFENDKLAEVIRQCQQGDRESFVWLVDAYSPKLYQYFYRVCGSPDLAEDLLQDLFVKLLLKIRSYRHENKFDSWLFRVAANMVRDFFRSRQRQIKTAAMPDGDIMPAVSDVADEQFDRLETAEQVDILQMALKRLAREEREMIVLRHYSGLNYKDIAEQYGLPLGTVLSKVHRGMKKLNKIMTQVTENES